MVITHVGENHWGFTFFKKSVMRKERPSLDRQIRDNPSMKFMLKHFLYMQ